MENVTRHVLSFNKAHFLFKSQMILWMTNKICDPFIANLICDSWSDASASEADSVLTTPPATFVIAIVWSANYSSASVQQF